MKNRFNNHPFFKWPLNPPLKKIEGDVNKLNNKSSAEEKSSSLIPKKKKLSIQQSSEEKTQNKRRAKLSQKTQARIPFWSKNSRFNFPEK
jgi:hypothetical protein